MASKYIQVNNENPSDRGAEDGEWRGRTRRVTVLAREATILDDDYQPSNEEDGRLPPENKITAPTIDAFDYVSPNHPLCPTRAICVLDSAQQLARLRHHFEFWWDVLVAMDKQAKMNTNLTDQRIREVIRLGEENRELRREQDYMTVQRDMAEKRVEELISKLDGAYRERDRDQSIIALMNTTRQAKPATEGNNRDCVPHRDPMHDAHRFLWNISVDHENCPSSVTNALGTDPGTDDSALASCRPESAQKHTLPTNGKVDSPQTFLEDTCRKRRLSSTFISQEALPTRNRRPRLHNSLSQTASAIPELDKDRWEGRFSRHLLLSNLLPDEKDEIERKSNHVLRSDLAEFMEKYTKIWNSTGFWSSTSLDPSNNNTSVGGKGHETWRYVEAMQAKGETHYLKSRLADIMLYLEYVKEFNRQKKAGHPGQTAKTRATNVICGTASLPKVTAEKTRASFHQHKLIGERWWWSGCYLGHGFILLCSEETGKKVRNKYFKLDAFILYLLYNCRRTLACCREADDVVDMLLTDGKFPVQVSKEEVQQWIKDASCTNQENELIFHWQAWSTDAVASKASDFLSARLSTDFDQPELGDFSVLKRRPGEASG